MAEDDSVCAEDMKRFEKQFLEEQAVAGKASSCTQFTYGWCLIRSNKNTDIRKGILLLEELCHTGTDQRDYLFFLAQGYYKLGEYNTALKYINRVLQIEPKNQQALALQDDINGQMTRDGLIGAAIVGGASLFIGGAAVLMGLVFAKKGGR